MDDNKIAVVDYIFFGQIVKDFDDNNINVDTTKTMVFFEYIDRGINDVKKFKEYVEKRFPNVKDLIVTNNFMYIRDNTDYTLDHLYKDLELRSLCIICHQGGYPKPLITPSEVKDGIVIFVVTDIQEQYGESVVGDSFNEETIWYEHIYGEYLAYLWEPGPYGYDHNYPFPMCGNEWIKNVDA